MLTRLRSVVPVLQHSPKDGKVNKSYGTVMLRDWLTR